MNKRELSKNVKFLMTHLEELFQDEDHLFDEYVNYEVLHQLEKELNNEFQGLIATINYYKEQKDKANERKYQEAIEIVKEQMNHLSAYKNDYRKRLKKEKRKQKENQKKLQQKKRFKPITKELPPSPVLEDLLHLKSPYMNQAFKEFIIDIKRSKYLEEYYVGLKYSMPVELEKLMNKTNHLTEEEKDELAVVISDVAKNKKRSLDKKDIGFEIERYFLQEVIKLLSNLKSPVYEDIQEDTTPYYNILVSLSEKDYNYPYIERLLIENPKFINAKKNGKPIALYLVEEFIYHYRQKLMNHKNDWIDPQFYKKIILLMCQEGLSFSQTEEVEFFQKLEEFKDYASQRRYTMLKDVLKDIAEIENAYERKIERNEEKEEKIKQEIQQIKNFKIQDAALSFMRKGYPYYEAFQFSKIMNYAFSITYRDDGSIDLHIHMLDTSSMIEKDSMLYEELKKGKASLPKMHVNKIYPVMTFTYSLNNNRISNLEVSSSTILINKVYKEKDLDHYRSIPELKMMVTFLKRLTQAKNIDTNIHYQEGVNDTINSSLNMDITKSFKENKMPFIWQGQLENSEEIINENHNAVCTELMNIKKEEAHSIFKILDEPPTAFYTVESKGILELDSTKFLGMYLLETIHTIQSGTYNIEDVQKKLKEILDVLNNTEKGYYPTCAEQEDLKLLRTIHHEYKKGQEQNS